MLSAIQNRFIQQLLLMISLVFAFSGLANAVSFDNFKGEQKKVEDYLGNGKWTVVMFWASDCHICRVKAPQYVAFQEKHKDGNIRMVGMALDGNINRADVEAFIADNKLNFPNLTGAPEDVAGFYQDNTGANFVGTPTFMIYSPDGEVRAADSGAIPVSIIEDFINNYQTATE
jgi:thiol-disulfide isomerase/thioredoxin